MTLTEILPTLRRSIPDPLEARAWPVHTVPTVDDVVIGGVSLTRLAEISGTPALLTGDLPHPAHARIEEIGNDVTVLVFRITRRVDAEADRPIALTECRFDRVAACWDQCRLIGRSSTAKSAAIELRPEQSGSEPGLARTVCLPCDLCAGDLVATPCAGAVSLPDVHPAPRPSAVPAAQAITRAGTMVLGHVTSHGGCNSGGEADDDEQRPGRCLK